MVRNTIFSLLLHYGNPILFIGLVAEYLGLPFVPGEAIMSFMGFAELKASPFAIPLSILWASAGTFTGSMAAWLIAYKYGEKLVLTIGKPLHLTRKKLDQVKTAFDRHKAAYIIVSRFVPGVRHIVPYISGISRMNAGKYTLLSLSGSILWCSFFIGLGSLLGDKWRMLVDLAKMYSVAFLLLSAFVFLAIRFLKKHRTILFSVTFPLLAFIMMGEEVIRKGIAGLRQRYLQAHSRFPYGRYD